MGHTKERILGLVLEGGGAKGAFSFGVIKAFQAAGLKFSIVSGTSVGALNAVILATDSIAEGEEIWTKLSFQKIFKRNYPRPLRWLAMPIIYVTQIFQSLNGPPIPGAGIKWVKFALAFLLVTPPSILNLAAYAETTGALIASCLVGSAASGFIAYSIATRDSDSSVGASSGWFWIVALWIVLLIVAVASVFGRLGALWGVALGAVLVGAYKVARTTSHDSSPLRAILETFLKRPLQARLFVTTARRDLLWIPDEIDSLNRTLAGASIPVRKRYDEYVPVHHNLNDMDESGRLLSALASASLPLGLVQGVVIGADKHVDGGVADNCPIYPILDSEKCTDIIVLHLSTRLEHEQELPWTKSGTDSVFPYKGIESNDGLYLCWMRFNRFKYLIEFCRSHPFPFDLETKVAEDSFWPADRRPKLPSANRIHHLFPDCSLGGFISGTLNFSAERACELIAAGEAKGKVFAEELLRLWSREEAMAQDDSG